LFDHSQCASYEFAAARRRLPDRRRAMTAGELVREIAIYTVLHGSIWQRTCVNTRIDLDATAEAGTQPQV